jgi:hypothetical protein
MTMMTRRRTAYSALTAAASLLLCAVATAQASGSGPEDGTRQAAAVAGSPPAEQLHELDFLLGKLDCTFNTGVTSRGDTRLTLGGNYYQLEVHSRNPDGTPKINGQWIIGWSAVDNAFQSYYVDDAQNQGTSSSPGWQDGHLDFVGSTILGAAGVRALTKDHFTMIDENHFTLDAFVQVKGQWVLVDTQDCHRRPRS